MTADHPPETRLPEALESVPPSARLVYLYLHDHGPATQQEIAKGTRTPPRTIRYALEQLRKEGLLDEQHSLADARQSYYSTSPPPR